MVSDKSIGVGQPYPYRAYVYGQLTEMYGPAKAAEMVKAIDSGDLGAALEIALRIRT